MNIDKTKIKNKLMSLGKTVLMIVVLLICIESGYFWLYFLGLMIYGGWLKRDVYSSWWGWYKGALRKAWNKEGTEDLNIQNMIMMGSVPKKEKKDDDKKEEEE